MGIVHAQAVMSHLLCPCASGEHGQNTRPASHVHNHFPVEQVFVVLDGVHIAHRSYLQIPTIIFLKMSRYTRPRRSDSRKNRMYAVDILAGAIGRHEALI